MLYYAKLRESYGRTGAVVFILLPVPARRIERGAVVPGVAVPGVVPTGVVPRRVPAALGVVVPGA